MAQKLEIYDIDLNSSEVTFGVKLTESSEWVQYSVNEFMFYLQHVGRIDAYDPSRKIGIVVSERYCPIANDVITERAYTYSAIDLMRDIMQGNSGMEFENFVSLQTATI